MVSNRRSSCHTHYSWPFMGKKQNSDHAPSGIRFLTEWMSPFCLKKARSRQTDRRKRAGIHRRVRATWLIELLNCRKRLLFTFSEAIFAIRDPELVRVDRIGEYSVCFESVLINCSL